MLKKIIKKGLHKVGFDLHRLSIISNPAFQLLKGLEKFNVDLVFDIGANTGQFASELRAIGYKGQLISFEPLSGAHQALTEMAASDYGWTVHSRCAIGGIDGEIDINIAGNSVSSSVLPMLDVHSSTAKGSAYIGSEKTPISRLDTVGANYLQNASCPFMKIDTQGYEWEVLDGAPVILKKCKGVLLEMSLVPLYEGQHLWLDLIQRLESLGFVLWALQPGFTDGNTGQTLQIDGIFFRV